jgi:OmpA-OmpF porin, OOP family
MTRLATRILGWYGFLLLGLLCAPLAAHAQPVEDPGLSEPAPPKPPTPTPTPPVTTPRPPITTTSPPAVPLPPSSRFVPPPVVPPPPPEVQETTDVKEEWVAGDKNAPVAGDLYERLAAPTMMGPVGLLRTHTGDSGAPGRFRIGLHVSGFQQDNFLVAGAGGTKGDTNGRFTGDLTIGYTPWKYIEAYLSMFNASNRNQRNDPGRTDPEVILSLGDVAFGLKGRYPATRFLDVALHAGVKFLNSVSGIGPSGDSTNFAVDAITSLDVRHINAATAKVPLRFHFNLGFLMDNSIKLLPAGQCGTSTGNDPCIRSRVVETFAYGIGPSRVRIALAADTPLMIKSVGLQGFVEYHADIAVGSGDSTVLNALKNTVVGDRLTGKSMQSITIGLRVRPVAGLILDAGIDVGVQSPGFQFGPPLPGWNLIAGAAYAYDPTTQAPKTKIVTKTITREITRGIATGRVRGVVRDAQTRKVIGGATIRYLNRRENSQLSGDDGTFLSYGFTPGPVSVEASREDYNAGRVETAVAANGETPIEILVTAKPPAAGQLRIHVVDETGAPVTANVRLSSSSGNIVDADSEGPGNYTAKLAGGDYNMEVSSPQHLAKQKSVNVQAGQVQSVEIVVHKKPAQSRVQITKDEIKIKGVVHFGTNNAELKPDAEQLLDEVVDVLVKHPEIRRVRVEGHTDNRGNPQLNLQLSKARAQAVMQYLVKQGVDAARLESEGYGATQPLVPNLTPANRAKNRRVTLRILEQGAPTP